MNRQHREQDKTGIRDQGLGIRNNANDPIQNPKSKIQNRKAFTLIELLVVIAIISILAALLFPVFARARDKARQTTCASNFKQQATAITLYVQDYDETMPVAFATNATGTFNSPPARIYMQDVMPYLKNTEVFRCPSDPASDQQRLTVSVPPPTTPRQREFNLAVKNNFGINFEYLSPIIYDATTGFASVPTHLAAIESSAQTLLGVDCVHLRDANGTPYGGGAGGVDMPCWDYSDGASSVPLPNQPRYWLGGWNPSQPKASNVFGNVWPWHSEFATVAFCDGHIKALTMNALAAGCDVRDRSAGRITDKDAYLWDLQ